METLRKATGTATRAIFGDDESRKSTEKGISEDQFKSGSQPETELQPEAERQPELAKLPDFEQQHESARPPEVTLEKPPQSEQQSEQAVAPSHEQRDSSKLKDLAATAALYNKTQGETKQKSVTRQPDDEHRLSAAGKFIWRHALNRTRSLTICRGSSFFEICQTPRITLISCGRCFRQTFICRRCCKSCQCPSETNRALETRSFSFGLSCSGTRERL